MTLLSFFLWFPVFTAAIVVSFILPGYLLTSKIKVLPFSYKFLLSIGMGIICWAGQGYIFGYLHIRWMTYIAILATLFFSFLLRRRILQELLEVFREIRKINRIVIAIILIGSAIELIPVFLSGLQYQDGVRFFNVNATDGIMHLGYIQSITHYFPPIEPGSFGTEIKNYHYWSDLAIAEIARIWNIPIPHLFFRFFPIFLSLITGLSTYYFIFAITKRKLAAGLAVFFMYFGGDAPFIFTLIPYHAFGFNTPAIDNGALQFLNMPHAMAKSLFIVSLIGFWFWTETKDKLLGVITAVLFASLIGFKIYFGLFALMGLVMVITAMLLKNILDPTTRSKNEILYLLTLLITAGLISSAIYFPPNSTSGGLYVDPLEWPRLLLGFGGVNLTFWWQVNRFIELHKLSFLFPVQDAIAIVISAIIVYGTRLLGFLSFKSLTKSYIFLSLFFFPALLVFQFLGFFTMQVSGGLNVFNFFAVSAAVLALITPLFLVNLYKSRLGYLLIVAVIMCTLPRVIYEIGNNISNYINKKDSYLVTNQELAAFTFLQKNTKGGAIVQADPSNHWDMRTPYVAFFSDRYSLFSGVGLQETHNTPTREREESLTTIFTAPNSADFANKLKQNHINYAYIRKNSEEIMPYKLTEGHFNYVFQNGGVLIVSPKN